MPFSAQVFYIKIVSAQYLHLPDRIIGHGQNNETVIRAGAVAHDLLQQRL